MLRKYIKTLAAVFVLTLVAAVFIPAQSADAVSGLTQPNIYKDKIVVDISSDALPIGTVDKIYLDVRVNNENFNRINSFEGNTRQITISGVSPRNTYDIRVTCDYTLSSGSKQTDYPVGSIYDAAMAPIKVKGLKQKVWYCTSGSLDTEWTKQPAVTGYQYQLYNNTGKKVRSGRLTRDYEAYAYFKNLSSRTYRMRVRAYTEFNGSRRYGKWSNYLNIVPPVKKVSASSNSKRKITVKWDKVKGATSYTIMVSTKRDSGYKATKTVSSKTSKTTINKIGKSKLKSDTYYYIYVRPNKKIDGKNVHSTLKNATIYYVFGRTQ